jgi:hypothetical protein
MAAAFHPGEEYVHAIFSSLDRAIGMFSPAASPSSTTPYIHGWIQLILHFFIFLFEFRFEYG